MDYACGKFDDCSFSHVGSIVRTDTHTDVDDRFTHRTRQRANCLTLRIV